MFNLIIGILCTIVTVVLAMQGDATGAATGGFFAGGNIAIATLEMAEKGDKSGK